MVSNLQDIATFERTTSDKSSIEQTCRNCKDFIEVIATTETPVTAEDGDIKHTTLEFLNPTCNHNNRILVFSQIKSFDKCPKGLW